MRQSTAIPFAAVAAAGVVALTAMVRHQREEPSPPVASVWATMGTGSVLWDVPVFSSTDQDSKPFSSMDLQGKVWVADFVFTGCANACPLLSRQMAQVQRQLADSRVHFVSFDVDPDHDTPAKLKEYGTTYNADFSRWHFLAFPSRPAIFELAKGMKVTSQQDDKDFQLLHSDHFLLVDGDGHVRGVYDATRDKSLYQLEVDALRLSGASPPSATQ